MKKITMHIGAPKCGSSALQSLLWHLENEKMLEKNNIKFPLQYSRAIDEGNADIIIEESAKNKTDYLQTKKFLEFNAQNYDHIVLSDEVLFTYMEDCFANMLPVFSDIFDEINIVLAIREPSSWLLSDYSQHIKVNASTKDFIKHIISREKYIQWDNYIEEVLKVKGKYNFIVVDYKGLFDCISKCINCDLNKAQKENNFQLKANLSIKHKNIELYRLAYMLNLSEEQIEKLRQNSTIKEPKQEYWSLIEYLKEKYKNYEEKLNSMAMESTNFQRW